MRSQIFLATALFLLTSPAFAIEWSTQNLLWDDTALLAPGASSWSLSRQSREVDERLDTKGEPEFIGRSTKQYQRSEGATVVREFQMRIQYERWMPTWAFGISPKWTIMARVPFTRLNAGSSERVYSEDSAQVSAAGFEKSDASTAGGLQVPPGGEYAATRVGQFEIKSKYQVYRGVRTRLVTTQTFKFPTAEKTKIDFIAFPSLPPTGFAAGAGINGRSYLASGWSAIYSGQYLHHFSDSVYGRSQDGFPTEERVNRDPGGEYQALVGARYLLAESVFVQSGLRHQFKFEDRYESTEDAAKGLVSEEERQSLYLNLAYLPPSRIQAVTLNGLSIAGQLGWETTLDGRNVETGDALNMELQIQF